MNENLNGMRWGGLRLHAGPVHTCISTDLKRWFNSISLHSSCFWDNVRIRAIRASTLTSCLCSVNGGEFELLFVRNVKPRPDVGDGDAFGDFCGDWILYLRLEVGANCWVKPHENTNDDNEWKWDNRTIACTTSDNDQLCGPFVNRYINDMKAKSKERQLASWIRTTWIVDHLPLYALCSTAMADEPKFC